MKIIIALFSIVILSGCGLQNQINQLKDQQTRTNGSISDLEKRVKVLEDTANSNIRMINENASLLSTLQLFYNYLSSQEGADAASLQAQITSLNNTIANLQTVVTTQVLSIATLQLNENITSFRDFCGTKAGSYNEVGMVTSSGKIVVYFENGGNRFLSVLKDGNYKTSDGTNCYFSVTNGGTLITNEHY